MHRQSRVVAAIIYLEMFFFKQHIDKHDDILKDAIIQIYKEENSHKTT